MLPQLETSMTVELEGVDLDVAVAKAIGYNAGIRVRENGERYCFVSSDGTHEYVGPDGWLLGGHVIHQHKISLQHVPATPGRSDLPEFWSANILTDRTEPDPSEGGTMEVFVTAYGPDPLTAAMRCFVASR